MNQSSSMTGNTTYDMAIRNVKNRTFNVLRGANRCGVLEDSDDDNEVQNVRFASKRSRPNYFSAYQP